MTTMPFEQENPKDIVGSRKPPLHLIPLSAKIAMSNGFRAGGDYGGPPLHRIPLSAKIAMSMGFKDGVYKYGPFNWRSIKIKASPYVVAAQRHIDLWYDCSEEFAKDSGVHHLGHAMATLAILYDALVNGGLNDDRPIPSKARELFTLPPPLQLLNCRSTKIKASLYVVTAQTDIGLWFDCSKEFVMGSYVHHLGHAMATLAVLYDALINDVLNDDRPIPSKASELMDRHTEKALPKEPDVVVNPSEMTFPAQTEELIQQGRETDAERYRAESDCPNTLSPLDLNPEVSCPEAGYNPIDPSTWCDDKRGTNTLDGSPAPEAPKCRIFNLHNNQMANQLQGGTFFVDTTQDICQVLYDNKLAYMRVVCFSVGEPYIRPISADEVEVDRVITQEEAILLCLK